VLAKKEKLKNEVFEICKNSPDIDIGDRFKGVISADSSNCYDNKHCHCIGKVNDENRVLFTDDMLSCFSVYGGWGEKGGFLYTLGIGNQMNFGQRMDIRKLELYVENMPKPLGMYTAMNQQFAKEYIRQIICYLQELKEN
jgi:hypothetical protein